MTACPVLTTNDRLEISDHYLFQSPDNRTSSMVYLGFGYTCMAAKVDLICLEALPAL